MADKATSPRTSGSIQGLFAASRTSRAAGGLSLSQLSLLDSSDFVFLKKQIKSKLWFSEFWCTTFPEIRVGIRAQVQISAVCMLLMVVIAVVMVMVMATIRPAMYDPYVVPDMQPYHDHHHYDPAGRGRRRHISSQRYICSSVRHGAS